MGFNPFISSGSGSSSTYNYTTFDEIEIDTKDKTMEQILKEIADLKLPVNTIITGQIYNAAAPDSRINNYEAEIQITEGIYGQIYWCKATSSSISPYSWDSIYTETTNEEKPIDNILPWTPTYYQSAEIKEIKEKISLIEQEEVGKFYKDEDNAILGEIFNNYENNVASGKQSHAEGTNTTASGDYSHANGSGNTSAGYASFSSGEGNLIYGNTSQGIGKSNTLGKKELAEGEKQSESSFVGGSGNNLIGNYAFIYGKDNINEGNENVVLGSGNKTYGTNKFSIGFSNKNGSEEDKGVYGFTFGFGNTINGSTGYAIGQSCVVENSGISIGYGAKSRNFSIGISSDITGNGVSAVNNHSIAIGSFQSRETGTNSISIGMASVAQGNYGANIGTQNQSIGDDSYIYGYNNTEKKTNNEDNVFNNIIVGTNNTLTSGTNVCLLGHHLTSENNTYLTIIGKYNKNDDNNTWSFLIGNGSGVSDADDKEKNIFGISKSGGIWFNGEFYDIGKNLKLNIPVGNPGGGLVLANGPGTTATGSCAIASGFSATSSGQAATAFGLGVKADGQSCFAGGMGTTASGSCSISFGSGSVVDGTNNASLASANDHIYGHENFCAASSGSQIKKEASNSVIFGSGHNIKNGSYNYCLGVGNSIGTEVTEDNPQPYEPQYVGLLGRGNQSITGKDSFGTGFGLIVNGQNQLVSGKYNNDDPDSKMAFIIGNGTEKTSSADESRSNLFSIGWDGKFYLNNSSNGIDLNKLITGINLTADNTGKITGGTATLADASTIPITIITSE